MKPSTQTMTGMDSSSASRKARILQIDRLLVGFGEQLEFQPASRIAMASEWSFQILIGAPIARLPRVMTMGSPRPAAL